MLVHFIKAGITRIRDISFFQLYKGLVLPKFFIVGMIHENYNSTKYIIDYYAALLNNNTRRVENCCLKFCSLFSKFLLCVENYIMVFFSIYSKLTLQIVNTKFVQSRNIKQILG